MTEVPFSVCIELRYQGRVQLEWMPGGMIVPWEGVAEILGTLGVGWRYAGCRPLHLRHDVVGFRVHEGSRTDANNGGKERVQQVCQGGRGYAEGSMAKRVGSRNLMDFQFIYAGHR